MGLHFDSIDQCSCIYANIFWLSIYLSLVQLEISNGDTSKQFFIVQDCFSYSISFLNFLYEVVSCCFKICEET